MEQSTFSFRSYYGTDERTNYEQAPQCRLLTCADVCLNMQRWLR